MLKFARAATLSVVLFASPAFADGGVKVTLPDVSDISGRPADDLLYNLVLANVVSSNCQGYEISDGEWALITGTADRLAEQLEIETASYDSNYYGPAFAELDEEGTCERVGPTIDPLIADLIDLGGSTKVIREDGDEPAEPTPASGTSKSGDKN